MCSGIAGRAALQQGLQGRGSLAVPESFCAEAEPVPPETHPTGITEMCSGCTSWQPGAGTGTARLCHTPGELGQFPSTRSAVPLLSKANHPQNNEPSPAHTALGLHETSLPDKGEKAERTRRWGMRDTAGNIPCYQGCLCQRPPNRWHGKPPQARGNAGMFPGRAEAFTGDARRDSVWMLGVPREDLLLGLMCR